MWRYACDILEHIIYWDGYILFWEILGQLETDTFWDILVFMVSE